MEKITSALARLGFDSSDYTVMPDCVILTATGRLKAETKHREITKAGLQYFQAGSIALAQPKGRIKPGYHKVKTQKPKRPTKVR